MRRLAKAALVSALIVAIFFTWGAIWFYSIPLLMSWGISHLLAGTIFPFATLFLIFTASAYQWVR